MVACAVANCKRVLKSASRLGGNVRFIRIHITTLTAQFYCPELTTVFLEKNHCKAYFVQKSKAIIAAVRYIHAQHDLKWASFIPNIFTLINWCMTLFIYLFYYGIVLSAQKIQKTMPKLYYTDVLTSRSYDCYVRARKTYYTKEHCCFHNVIIPFFLYMFHILMRIPFDHAHLQTICYEHV
jgi:hypothetical protein